MLNVRLPFSQCIRRSLLRLHIVCGFCGSATATEGKILLEQVSGPDQLPIYITWLIYLRFFIAQEILSTQAAWQKLHTSFFSVASCLHRRDKYVLRAPGTIYTCFYALKSCIYSSKPQPWVYQTSKEFITPTGNISDLYSCQRLWCLAQARYKYINIYTQRYIDRSWGMPFCECAACSGSPQ